MSEKYTLEAIHQFLKCWLINETSENVNRVCWEMVLPCFRPFILLLKGMLQNTLYVTNFADLITVCGWVTQKEQKLQKNQFNFCFFKIILVSQFVMT